MTRARWNGPAAQRLTVSSLLEMGEYRAPTAQIRRARSRTGLPPGGFDGKTDAQPGVKIRSQFVQSFWLRRRSVGSRTRKRAYMPGSQTTQVLAVLRAHKLANWRARRDCSALRASSLRDRRRAVRGGVQLGRGRPSCRTRLVCLSGVRICGPAGDLQPTIAFVSRKNLARPERFELPTSWFVARRSIQLSYGRIDKTTAASSAIQRNKRELST